MLLLDNLNPYFISLYLSKDINALSDCNFHLFALTSIRSWNSNKENFEND